MISREEVKSDVFVVTLSEKWFNDPFADELVIVGEPEQETDDNGDIFYIYKVEFNNNEINKR